MASVCGNSWTLSGRPESKKRISHKKGTKSTQGVTSCLSHSPPKLGGEPRSGGAKREPDRAKLEDLFKVRAKRNCWKKGALRGYLKVASRSLNRPPRRCAAPRLT